MGEGENGSQFWRKGGHSSSAYFKTLGNVQDSILSALGINKSIKQIKTGKCYLDS